MKTGEKDTIDSLLNPLGLNIEHDDINNCWAIACWKTNCKCYARMARPERTGIVIGWVKLERLENDLLTQIEAFVTYSSCIKNPYLGCANLEEAFILKDLEFDSHGQ